MINIPRNTYVQPTSVREEVVQGICEAFLRSEYSSFHPFSDGVYRQKTIYIARHKGRKTYRRFRSEFFNDEEGVRFTGAEMKRAFEELIKAGYYMYRIYEFGTWEGYVCDKKPFREGGTRVTSFDDFID